MLVRRLPLLLALLLVVALVLVRTCEAAEKKPRWATKPDWWPTPPLEPIQAWPDPPDPDSYTKGDDPSLPPDEVGSPQSVARSNQAGDTGTEDTQG